MTLFLALLVFWTIVLLVARFFWIRWRQRSYLRPARYVSEIQGVDYFRSLSPAQFENLIELGLKARKFTLLGDPYLGRSGKQGYAWRAGRKVVLVYKPDKPLIAKELSDISIQQKKARAEQALVFSPFPKAARVFQPGLEVLVGKKLVSWFSVLDDLRPPVSGKISPERCECDSVMEERVNRGGQPLLVCSRYPDCKNMRKPVA